MSRNTRWGVPGNRWDQPTKHSTLITARVATVNASVTPDTVVAQVFIDTPSVTADANVTPTTVVAQAFIDTPAITADANITPTTVTAQAFVDTPTVATIRIIHIATAVHRSSDVQLARLQSRVTTGKVVTAGADASVTPTTVAATTTIDTPTVTGDANITPTTVVAQVFVDTPTVTGDANVTPTTVIAQAFVDTPNVTAIKPPQQVEAPGRAARNTRGPQLRIRSSVIQGRTTVVSVDASVTLDTVVATAFIDTPSVSVARALKILAASDRKLKVRGPRLRKRSSVIQGFIPTPPATVDANVTAGDVVATTSIPTPSVAAGRLQAQTIAAVQLAAPPQPSRLQSRVTTGKVVVAVDASVTPTTVVAQASIPTPEITGDANLTAGDVAAQGFIPTPTVAGNADVTTTTVAAVVSVPTPSLTNDANITPTTVVAQATVPTPSIYATLPGDVDVVPDTVVAVVNMDALPFVEPGGLIRHRGLIGYGFSNSSPFGNRRP